MKETTQNIITKHVGMSIQQIQTTSWDDIEKNIFKRLKFRGFHPEHYFQVNGNIHMEQNRYMGTTRIDFFNTLNYMSYKLKCLIRNYKKK